MKKNNLEEARELIRKSLGLSKPENKSRANSPEQAPSAISEAKYPAAASPNEEDKFAFGNRGTIKAKQPENITEAQKEMEKPDSQIVPKDIQKMKGQNAIAGKNSKLQDYMVYGIVAIFIIATIVGYGFILFYARTEANGQQRT